jgi:hypothetical protein
MTAMSTNTDTIGSAAADAVSAPLDVLLTDAASGALRRVVQARLAAAHICRDGHLELTADPAGTAPMVEGFPTAETRQG